MIKPQALNSKQDGREGTAQTVMPLHVYRLFALFDRLYEFGATDYFARFHGLDEGYHLFNDALSGLDVEAINLGVSRLCNLDNRRKVFPEAKLFAWLCVMSDDQFQENKFLYEERISK